LAVRLFIQADIDVKKPDENGFSPLMIASWNGNADAAKLLIEKGADLNAALADGRTALQMSINRQHPELAKILVAKGAKDFNQLNKELAAAVINDMTNDVKTQLSKGANPNTRLCDIILEDSDELNIIESFRQYSVLALAAKQRLDGVATILLENGANPNLRSERGLSYSPLLRAIEKTNTAMVKLLLKHKAFIYDEELRIAHDNHFNEIEQLLIEADDRK
jgi:ankyrin repeat protein